VNSNTNNGNHWMKRPLPNQPSLPLFLEISVKHLILVERKDQKYHIPASDVRVGDILSGQQVESIQLVTRRGVYAPLTQSGEILVNGFVASNYVKQLDLPTLLSFDQHVFVHMLFHPQRLFCHYLIEVCKREIYWNGFVIFS
jgi:Hint module